MRADFSTRALWPLRLALHAGLVILAALPWAIGCLGYWAAMWLTVWADRVWPDATHGNCWSFVGPKWLKEGGYVVVRWAHPPMGRIPHSIWMRNIPEGAEIQQTEPVRRARRWWQAHRTLYFRWRIVDREKRR